MKITDIQKQKHNSKRYSIFIDGEFAFGLDEIDVLYYKLLNTSEISEEKLNYIKENVLFSKARDTAVKYLSFKSRTKKEIVLKLEEKDYPKDIIEKVIKLLEKYNYINDYNYAGSFLRDKFNLNGFGIERIKYELKQKGISEEITQKVIEDNPLNETEKAAELVRRKYGEYNFDIKERRKIAGFLQRRGFSYDTTKAVFDLLKQSQKNETSS